MYDAFIFTITTLIEVTSSHLAGTKLVKFYLCFLQTLMSARVTFVNKYVPTHWGAMNVVVMMDIQ